MYSLRGRGSADRLAIQDDEFVIFKDRSPGSKVHLLAVPKRHVGTCGFEAVSIAELGPALIAELDR